MLGRSEAKRLDGLTAKLAVAVAGVGLALAATPARAVPSFAVQTGQPCQACHVGGFGPQLTPFGREFKLHGYTQRAGGFTMPLSIAVTASYIHSQANQSAPPAPGFGVNDNFALDQINGFLAGGAGHFGGFVQATYDGIGKAFTWDNLDLRAVTTAQVKGADVVFGASLNNAPGVQDPWNTLPAWGFPYTSSAIAPSPSTPTPLIGALAGTTLGLTGYAWINSEFYIEGGAYQSPSQSFLYHLGADPSSPGDIAGAAPYGRIAFEKGVGGGVLELGGMVMQANIHPGNDRTTGLTDGYLDLAVDGSYQRVLGDGDMITVNSRYLHEQQTLNATCALDAPSGDTPDVEAVVATPIQGCAKNRLEDVRVDGSYYWRNKIGATVQVFDTYGSANSILYAGNRTDRPDSAGVTLQVDGTPFGDGSSPLGKRFNMRVGVQYTIYTRFDGAGSNYDGQGGNASDNNTLRVFTWLAY